MYSKNEPNSNGRLGKVTTHKCQPSRKQGCSWLLGW